MFKLLEFTCWKWDAKKGDALCLVTVCLLSLLLYNSFPLSSLFFIETSLNNASRMRTLNMPMPGPLRQCMVHLPTMYQCPCCPGQQQPNIIQDQLVMGSCPAWQSPLPPTVTWLLNSALSLRSCSIMSCLDLVLFLDIPPCSGCPTVLNSCG